VRAATSIYVLEIGIYSGGSLEMWHDYFGEHATIYGVDIEPTCKIYERPGVKVFIGDQSDRNFWKTFKAQVPLLDVVIDDGGHEMEQQIATLEELLPHMRPGGVFLCEDVHGAFNGFALYAHGLGHKLHAASPLHNMEDEESRIVSPTTPFQSAISSIHLYPFVVVLKKHTEKVSELRAPKHATNWQPYLR
jgi:hypothetical protein